MLTRKEWPFLLPMLGCVFGTITVMPQSFTVEHSANDLPQGNLTILCQPSFTDIVAVTFIQIRKRHKEDKEDFPLVTLSPDLNSGYPVKEAGLSNRNSVISAVIRDDVPQESYLRLEFADASCLDEGTFICNSVFYQEGSNDAKIMTDSANVTTKTLPDKLLMLQKPAYDSFLVNQTVELRCSGQVGSPPAWFRWKWRRINSSKESEFQFVTFGVHHGEGPYPQGFCRYFRASTLYLRASQWLDGVEIRCSLVRDETEYVELSASFIFKVKEAGCIPDCWNGGVCVNNKCHCPGNFTGSFCEQPVGPAPCYTLDCQESNRGTDMNIASTLHFLLPVFVLLLLRHM